MCPNVTRRASFRSPIAGSAADVSRLWRRFASFRGPRSETLTATTVRSSRVERPLLEVDGEGSIPSERVHRPVVQGRTLGESRGWHIDWPGSANSTSQWGRSSTGKSERRSQGGAEPVGEAYDSPLGKPSGEGAARTGNVSPSTGRSVDAGSSPAGPIHARVAQTRTVGRRDGRAPAF